MQLKFLLLGMSIVTNNFGSNVRFPDKHYATKIPAVSYVNCNNFGSNARFPDVD